MTELVTRTSIVAGSGPSGGGALFPFTLDGIKDAVAQAMAMRTVKSTIVPFEHLL